MPTVNDDFNRTVVAPRLDAERSCVFTPGARDIPFDEAALVHFNACLARIAPGSPALDGEQLAGAARRLARAVGEGNQTRFIQIRMRRLGEIRALLRDERWSCDDPLRQRMTDLLAYLDGPQRLTPDYMPVIGGLDAALLADLAMEDLRAELDEFADYCRFRQAEAARLGVSQDQVGIDRAQWTVERSEEVRLERQVQRIRKSSYAGGGGDGGFKVR